MTSQPQVAPNHDPRSPASPSPQSRTLHTSLLTYYTLTPVTSTSQTLQPQSHQYPLDQRTNTPCLRDRDLPAPPTPIPEVFLPLPRQAGAGFLGTLTDTGDQTQEASLPSFLGFTVLPASHLFLLGAPPLSPAPGSHRQPWPQVEPHSLPNTPGQWALAGCSLCLECLSLGSLTPRPLISLPKCLFLHIPTAPRLSLGYPSLGRFPGLPPSTRSLSRLQFSIGLVASLQLESKQPWA